METYLSVGVTVTLQNELDALWFFVVFFTRLPLVYVYVYVYVVLLLRPRANAFLAMIRIRGRSHRQNSTTALRSKMPLCCSDARKKTTKRRKK